MMVPPLLTRLLPTVATPERWALLHEFRRFGTVGLAGLAVETTFVYGLREVTNLFAAKAVALLIAVTTTWALNRAWTFAGRGSGSLLRQWALFAGANSLGAALNLGTFSLLVWLVPFCAAYPIVPILAGVAAGMFVNFAMSRRVVFRARP